LLLWHYSKEKKKIRKKLSAFDDVKIGEKKKKKKKNRKKIKKIFFF